jgi:Glycosyl hydrolase family 26
MGINGYTYASVAAASPGSAIYANIVRWADTIGSRSNLTFFGFMKEPEASDDAHFGSVSDYLAAYRHVVDIFRSQSLTNVHYVWQMTAYSFVSTGANAAIHYYPGDSYVDVVAEDPYNWGGCGPGGPWRNLSIAANPALSFAEAHGKLAMLGEFASQTGPLRASWLASAQQWLIANRGEIQAAFYFDRPPTTALGHACVWSLTSSADIAAFRAIVNDTTYFTN